MHSAVTPVPFSEGFKDKVYGIFITGACEYRLILQMCKKQKKTKPKMGRNF